MNKRLLQCLVLLVAPVFAAAQTATPPPPSPKVNATYKLSYNLTEVEGGRKLNTRSYSLMIREGRGSFRVGSRIPIVTNGASVATGVAPPITQYMDIGVNIDARIITGGADDEVIIESNVEVSGVSAAVSEKNPLNPVVRQSKSFVSAGVTLGKPTVIATLDDVDSPRHTEIELTATRVK